MLTVILQIKLYHLFQLFSDILQQGSSHDEDVDEVQDIFETSCDVQTQTETPVSESNQHSKIFRSFGTQTNPIGVKSVGYQIDRKPLQSHQKIQVKPIVSDVICQVDIPGRYNFQSLYK